MFAERSKRGHVSLLTRRLLGAVGIGPNEDHPTLAETDRLGNLVGIRGMRFNLHGKSEEETEAIFAFKWKKIFRALRRIGQGACDRTIGSSQAKGQAGVRRSRSGRLAFFLRLCSGDRDYSKSAFFCAGRGRDDPSRAFLHLCDRRGQPRASSGHGFSRARGVVPPPGEDRVSPNAHSCERR